MISRGELYKDLERAEFWINFYSAAIRLNGVCLPHVESMREAIEELKNDRDYILGLIDEYKLQNDNRH